jgi:hypothetical protein
LLNVTGLPLIPAFRPHVDSIVGVLWYNVFATNDGIAELGGQPFDKRRVYSGSADDALLNSMVERLN